MAMSYSNSTLPPPRYGYTGRRRHAEEDRKRIAFHPPLTAFWRMGPKLFNGESKHWLARLCYWVLGRLGVESERGPETNHYIRTFDVDTDLTAKIMEHADAVRRIMRGQTHLRLVIGHKQMLQLKRECPNDYFYFDHYARAVEAVGGSVRVDTIYREVFMDMRVEVVPWWEGYLVLPDDSR